MRRIAVVLALLLTVTTAEARRRAVRIPESPVDTGTFAGWLFANARVLESTSLIASTDDLAPLRALAASATVVGLGDLTHGTREVQTVKLRMIDVLVRDLGFDVVALEAPFALFNRLNTYVQGGSGDPRALLAAEAQIYPFWNTEEMLVVIEWMRAYNASRGNRPAIELAGVDVYAEAAAAADVVAYLEGVDGAAAQQAGTDYECIRVATYSVPCREAVTRVRAALAQKESQYTATTSARAYHDALQSATVVVQSRLGVGSRDQYMSENVLWMRTHRGTSGKVVYWAHNEHVAEATGGTPYDAGFRLATALGDRYVTVATMAGSGWFLGWKFNTATRLLDQVAARLSEPAPETYEWYFRQRGASAIFVPLRGVTVPAWLAGPAQYRWGAVDASLAVSRIALPSHFDAVVYIEDTTPLRPLEKTEAR